VRRRGWLTDAAYLDLVGAANLIPGPTSTEVAMHLGHRRAGWPGLVVAGTAFILPAVLIVGILAWAYVTAGTRVALDPVIAGVGPVVIALIVHAGWSIGRTALRTRRAVALAGAAIAGSLAGLPEILVLLGLGVVAVAMAGAMRIPAGRSHRVLVGLPIGGLAAPGRGLGPLVDGRLGWALGPVGPTPLAIFVELALIGATVFGSGYVLIAYLQAEIVDRLGWITSAQLVDAVAVGQATPGPVFSTATFVGYLAAGPVGATAATIGIFLPAFIAVAVSIPVLDRLRASATFRAFLDGVNAAAVGLLAVVAVRLGLEILVEPVAWLVAAIALVLLWRGVPSPLLIVIGALIGVARALAGT
jgi:chromate transporter